MVESSLECVSSTETEMWREREREGGVISCGICLLKNDERVESAVECVSTEKKATFLMVFFCWRRRESWNISWNGQHWEGGEREGGDIPHGICLLMNDGMVESICHRMCQHKERQKRRRETGRRISFSMIGFFLGFWQRMLDLELGLQWNWEGVLNWVAVSFFEASTKTSVGSSDSQRISCVSKSAAAGIVVDGAHTNSRHWNCGPWCPPLGSRPLCKQPLHLFLSSLLPPLEKIKFCKLLSSSCKNAHKDQVILEFWILECHKDLLVILEFFKVYLCNVVKMRWFWSSFFVSIFRWCWTMESCKWLSLSLKGSSLAWAMEVSRMCSRLVTRKQIEGNFETLILLLFFHLFFPWSSSPLQNHLVVFSPFLSFLKFFLCHVFCVIEICSLYLFPLCEFKALEVSGLQVLGSELE